MRGLIGAIVAVTVAMAGCNGGAEKAKSPQANETPAGTTKPCAVRSGGRDLLHLAVPADAPCTSGDGTLNVMSRDGYVEFWLVSGARTVDEGVKRADKVIVSEFKNLKVTGTNDLKVAGSPAKRLTGTGQEADDNDPGEADLVVFSVNGRVFIACTHGESMRPSAQSLMMEMLKTAKAP